MTSAKHLICSRTALENCLIYNSIKQKKAHIWEHGKSELFFCLLFYFHLMLKHWLVSLHNILTSCAYWSKRKCIWDMMSETAPFFIQAVWRNRLRVWGISGGANHDQLAVEVYWLLVFDHIITLARLLSVFPFSLWPHVAPSSLYFSSCCPVSVPHYKLHKHVKSSWVVKKPNIKINK